ncbi:PIN domain protein [Bordetella hinzii CA90 BAL1384]|uniref:PIN domain protein n=2 Tax=Bordetella hinzii TaxID=103855 RepID=A0ABR4R6B7_9BORD|nr:PIN domain protein [Bordetella hinzii OH87 BAL007II]KCB32536.1 PIN domain protein [Bordetella hinzii CA90 BAL1384]KCB40913.1 PIN domain protein [Bordetella hinzii 5132]QDJ40347.1 PIN domain-containing protein [Bordetella hinzii]QDJ44858.1 PIN domain-containing protein [Bordetella hinzii]
MLAEKPRPVSRTPAISDAAAKTRPASAILPPFLPPAPAPCPLPSILSQPAPYIVLDACVLMSNIVRRLMLRLAAAQVYQPVWTERIGQEWRRNAARLWEVPPAFLAEQWAEMNAQFPQALEHDIEPYEAGLRYSDPKDFHVIAAGLARRARCGLQVPPVVQVATWNLKDFNRSELRRQGLDAFNPDTLIARWHAQHPQAVLDALTPVPQDYVALGRDAEPLAATLHRERLYRVKSLVQ